MAIGPWMAAAIPAAVNLVSNLIGSGGQFIVNKKLSDYQNTYNSPKAQMQRFKDAGLNPHLIYSMGSAGNMTPIQPPNIQGAVGNLGTQYLESAQTQAQTDLTQTKTMESEIKQQVMVAQRDVLKANPYLSERYVKSLIDQVEAASKLKKQEATFYTEWVQSETPDGIVFRKRGFQKMQAELDLLESRVGLAGADQQIKAEILASAKFQNAFNEILNKFRVDGEVGPQQFWALLLMTLGKFK